jgi:ribosomal-protein-alanine N-acetyltransferase
MGDPDLTIRQMLSADIPRVAAVEDACFTTPWSEQSFYAEIQHRDSSAKVAEVGGAIIGYVCIRRVLDEWHLHDLAVTHAHRRRGVATRLLAAAEEEMRTAGGRLLFLEVRVSNHAGRAFYERRGFKVTGIRKRYYQHPDEDAVLMVREL